MKNYTFNRKLTRKTILNVKSSFTLSLPIVLSLSACSFVELNPAAQQVIIAKDPERCDIIETFDAEAALENMFIDRDKTGIREDLETMALNRAHEVKGNAIWPLTEENEGKQSFEILRCKRI